MSEQLAPLIPLPIDEVALCAYADQAFLRQREYWKAFLKLLLPTMLERESGEIDELVDHAQAKDWTTIVEENQPTETGAALVRHISACLSMAVGESAELGFASFLTCNLPTRTHRVVRVEVQDLNEQILVHWLHCVSLAQSQLEFCEQIENWKAHMAQLPLDHLAGPALREDEGDDAREVS